jgi:hypothetical protein
MGIIRRTFKDLTVNLLNILLWLFGISLILTPPIAGLGGNSGAIIMIVGFLVLIFTYTFASNYSSSKSESRSAQDRSSSKYEEYKKCIQDEDTKDSVCERILD